ncbi:MAG: hypothetical protein JF597_16405 [Streptomyces sp.]|uniref:hypothetical protein n=1 Tax=Streptomyces sp. TaxID=1931 RepID=UPI0025F32710|nr:hypothetical protein [Streptomyces sp.]MBW8795115.1 hypothetical protein [Streptomyces sp.]
MGFSDTPSSAHRSDASRPDGPGPGEEVPDPAPRAPRPSSVWRTAMVGLSALTVAVALVVAFV